MNTCEKTWRKNEPIPGEDTYRQHRCGKPDTPNHQHTCRYCGAEYHLQAITRR